MVSSNLKSIVDSKGLSIRKVANDLDYRFETVRRMYNDDMQHYPRNLLELLCEYLECDISDLLKTDKEKAAP